MVGVFERMAQGFGTNIYWEKLADIVEYTVRVQSEELEGHPGSDDCLVM
jgi:hypothetical protein